MAFSSSSPVQAMAFSQNVNGGVNGARLMGGNSTQQQHLVQLNPQDFMQNCQVKPGQQQSRSLNSGFDQSQQQQQQHLQQLQHQQPMQQFYNQTGQTNGYQMSCGNQNFQSQQQQPLQQQHSVHHQLHHNPQQFQQYQIQSNIQINKLGLQDDDMTGLTANDLHPPMSTGLQQVPQQNHQQFMNQGGSNQQPNQLQNNMSLQQFGSGNHNLLSQGVVGHQNNYMQQQQQQQQQLQQQQQQQQQLRYNIGNNSNGFQQNQQMSGMMQHSSPKQQPIQQHQLGLVQPASQQIDMSQMTGLVSMDEDSNKFNPLMQPYIPQQSQMQRSSMHCMNNGSPSNNNINNKNNNATNFQNHCSFNNVTTICKNMNSINMSQLKGEDEVIENEDDNQQEKSQIMPVKKGRGRPKKIVSNDDSKIPATKTVTLSNDSTTGQQTLGITSANALPSSGNPKRSTRSANRIVSYCSDQVKSTLKDSVQSTRSKAKTDVESSSAITRGGGAGEKGLEIPDEDEQGSYNYTEEEIVQQQKIYEAIQRKKYKEELKKKSQEQYSDDDDSENSQIDEKSFVPNSTFLKQYRQRLIGRSSNSKIFELKDSNTDENIGQVVKIVPHKMSNHHQIECGELRNEHRFLKKMEHPRIITLGTFTEFIRDRNYCGLLLPQAECNLMQFAKTQRHGKVSLSQMRIAFRQIAEAIHYLHENYISHNDIKPDNMFVFSEGDYKLADFGFAIDLPKPNSFKRNSRFSQTLRKQVKIEDLKKNWKQRCKQYVAPELIKLLNGKRPRLPSDEKACDVFALGVSFFIIIFYQLPFCGSALKTDQRYKHFFKGQNEKFWSQFKSMLTKFQQQENSHADELKDLFNKVLEPEPTKRLTIEQVLEHPWLNH